IAGDFSFYNISTKTESSSDFKAGGDIVSVYLNEQSGDFFVINNNFSPEKPSEFFYRSGVYKDNRIQSREYPVSYEKSGNVTSVFLENNGYSKTGDTLLTDSGGKLILAGNEKKERANLPELADYKLV